MHGKRGTERKGFETYREEKKTRPMQSRTMKGKSKVKHENPRVQQQLNRAAEKQERINKAI